MCFEVMASNLYFLVTSLTFGCRILNLRGVYCILHYQGPLMKEAVSTPETSICFYQTTRHNIPAESSSYLLP